MESSVFGDNSYKRLNNKKSRIHPEHQEPNMAGFFQQLKALMHRNILLKQRNRGQLFQELFFPVYFVIILAMIKNLTKPDTKKALHFPVNDLNERQFSVSFANKTILGVPKTSQVESWMKNITTQLPNSPKYQLFDTEVQAEAQYLLKPDSVAAGIIFNYSGNPNAYAIRMDYNSIPSTAGSIYDVGDTNGKCSDNENATSSSCTVNKYLTTGFALIQLAVENLLLENLNITLNPWSRNIKVQMMDREEYSPNISGIQATSSIYFVFSFLFLVSSLTVNIVAEKEKKRKDGMLMMGLRTSVFWLSWALVYFVLIAIAAGFMTLVIVLFKFFDQSNLLLLYIVFLLYGTSVITFSFMISAFFNKAKVAGAIAGFSTVIFSCIYLAISQTRDANSYNSNVPESVQWILCILSPISFATFIDQAIFLDLHLNGFHFDDTLTFGKFPLYAPIVMLVVDIFLYGLLTIYFDNVIPGEFGVKQHPLFFLQTSFWCSKKQIDETSKLVELNPNQSHGVDIEPLGRDMQEKVTMRISSLTKSFKVDGIVHKVVNDFFLDICESQITCLLGHNGAGKTTLINMLTGVVPPTSGTAKIMDLDITKASDMTKIRQRCGICPQHNILYDELSCREHLEMFANIKGVHWSVIHKTVKQALADVDLVSQSETLSKALSGGQKRKLSVAIALIGDPKLIFLDEPTAGMDPFSRRHLWSLLKKMKEGRVVLLTTHFMDEADILADRKAFIKKGKLRCCGSSLFLKNKFGIGYHLTMVVAPNCDVENVTKLLKKVIPDVERQRAHGKEIGFTIPLKDVSLFSDLFYMLDNIAEANGIKSYGVSMTTLEEVFLKLEADELADEDGDDNSGTINENFMVDNDVNINLQTPVADHVGKSTVRGSGLTSQRFWILLKVRFLLTFRNMKSLFFQVFLPVVLVIVGLVLSKTNEAKTTPAPIPLTFGPLMYVKPASVQAPLLNSPLLVFDKLNNTDSQAVITDWKKHYTVDTYAAGKNTSTVAPHLLGIQIEDLAGKNLKDLVVLYNDTAKHSIPVIINMATQSILAMSNINANISGSSLPWPSVLAEFTYNSGTMFSSMLIGLAFILIMPGFCGEIVKDRELKMRGQLRISGVTFNVYWGAIYICDLLIYLIPGVLIIIIVLALQIQGLSSGGAVSAIILLLATNIPFNIVLALVLSFLFNKSEVCYSYLPMILQIVSLIPYLVVSLVDMISHSNVAIIIHYVACVIDPPYLLYGGFYFINKVSLVAAVGQREVEVSDYYKFDNHVIITIIMPIIHVLWMYWLLRILDVWKAGGRFIEAFPCFSKNLESQLAENEDIIENEDDDVKAERIRVQHLDSGDNKECVAYTSQLRKVYEKRVKSSGGLLHKLYTFGKKKYKVAVRNLSVGVEPGEVFGLLGPNGAGKSTALSMVIAETAPTNGKVVVSGHNIRSHVLSVLEALGYCPQHDALWEIITLEEHIKCFAALKGIAPEQIDSVVDFFVDQLKLQEHRKKHAKKLSGGTKRKLSYILSILGSPHIVLLDEPSTGMDPQSKRFLWDTISSSFKDTSRGAILTTHYMEEADALCERVGIMINGELKCLGSTQHLKSKHGSGYILELKLASYDTREVDSLMTRLENHLKEFFPGLGTVERFQERAQYSIPKENVTSLGKTFANLESCKVTHGLEEYSFSQSTLEQVFLHFARQQLEEGDEEVSRERHGSGRRSYTHVRNRSSSSRSSDTKTV